MTSVVSIGTARAEVPATSSFVAVGPVRLADTRQANCGCTRSAPDSIRVAIADHPAVPVDEVVAAALTVTALPTATPGFVTAYPGGASRPATSTVNTSAHRVVANSTVVPLGSDGSVELFSSAPGEVIVDLTGVFVAAATSSDGRFVALPPTRLADTRSSGGVPPGGELTVGLPAGVPTDASALAVNVTSLAESAPGFVGGRPAGTPLGAPTSFLNTDGSGHAVAAAVILPVSPAGLTLYSHGGGHLVVDVTGWFTGESAADTAEGLFVPLTPQRLHDTRATAPRLAADGTIHLASPVAAAALVTNVTVTRADWRGFVTAYPAGTPRPATSSVNATRHDHTVANMAVTPMSTAGLAYYALAGTDLVVDVTGFFTGTPVAATQPQPPNSPARPRMLVVGDSAMAALEVYTEAKAAVAWAEVYYDSDNCRRLVHPSCLSDTTGRVPNTGLEAIVAAPGPFDVVYVDVGHNDWFDDDFAWQFDVIVQASRAQGAKVILWATYTEQPNIRDEARRAYAWNNWYLRYLTSLPQYSDVLVADWNAYSWNHPDWFWDGTHLYRAGAWGQAQFLSEQLAAVYHL